MSVSPGQFFCNGGPFCLGFVRRCSAGAEYSTGRRAAAGEVCLRRNRNSVRSFVHDIHHDESRLRWSCRTPGQFEGTTTYNCIISFFLIPLSNIGALSYCRDDGSGLCDDRRNNALFDGLR